MILSQIMTSGFSFINKRTNNFCAWLVTVMIYHGDFTRYHCPLLTRVDRVQTMWCSSLMRQLNNPLGEVWRTQCESKSSKEELEGGRDVDSKTYLAFLGFVKLIFKMGLFTLGWRDLYDNRWNDYAPMYVWTEF